MKLMDEEFAKTKDKVQDILYKATIDSFIYAMTNTKLDLTSLMSVVTCLRLDQSIKKLLQDREILKSYFAPPIVL